MDQIGIDLTVDGLITMSSSQFKARFVNLTCEVYFFLFFLFFF